MKKIVAPLLLALFIASLAPSVARAGHGHSVIDTISDVLNTLAILAVIDASTSRSYRYQPWGVIDTEVRPKRAEVYVDGSYAGRAKKFDGWPGYLPLDPGSYELEFVYPGYAPYRVRVRVVQGKRLVIKKRLRRLRPGDRPPRQARRAGPGNNPRPSRSHRPPPRSEEEGWRQGPPSSGGDDGGWREPGSGNNKDWRWSDGRSRREGEPRESRPDRDRTEPEAPRHEHSADGTCCQPEMTRSRAPLPAPREEPAAMSELRLRVNPDDASIYVDGEYYMNARDLDGGTRTILLPPGTYRIEVVRPGYESQVQNVTLNGNPRSLTLEMKKK